jgi:hypothetical protein
MNVPFFHPRQQQFVHDLSGRLDIRDQKIYPFHGATFSSGYGKALVWLCFGWVVSVP